MRKVRESKQYAHNKAIELWLRVTNDPQASYDATRNTRLTMAVQSARIMPLAATLHKDTQGPIWCWWRSSVGEHKFELADWSISKLEMCHGF